MAIRFRVEASFLVVGLGLLAGGIYAYYAIVVRPASWPQADALVVSSRVINPKGPSTYAPELVFRLDADGSTRDVRIAPSWSSSSYSVVRGHVDEFPAGRRVKVAVNPQNPRDVRYDLGVTMANMIAPGVLGVLGIVFAGVGVIALRAGRKKDEFAPAIPSERERVEGPVPSERQRVEGPTFDEAGRVVASGAGALRIVPRIFILIGVILAVIGGMMVRADLAMLKGWPEIDGRVLESRVVAGRSSGSRGSTRTYDTAVKFRYVVNDVTYENETRYGMGTSNRGSAAARAEAYTPGTVHRIWHRPDDPNLIRFDLDSKFAVFFLSSAIVVMGLVFMGFGGLIWRSMSARATSPEYPAFDAPQDQA